MRTMIITVRDRTVAAKPWLPWVLPGGLGGADALNLAEPSLPLYLLLLAISVTITTSTLVSRRLTRVAEQAPVDRAMLYGYQLRGEHCDEHLAAASARPIAVGENTLTLPRRLQSVQPPVDVAAASGHVYRSQQVPARSAAESMPAQATRLAHLASARPPQPRP